MMTEEEIEKEVLKKLPLFPHKSDGSRLTGEELDKLYKLIKESVLKQHKGL